MNREHHLENSMRTEETHNLESNRDMMKAQFLALKAVLDHCDTFQEAQIQLDTYNQKLDKYQLHEQKLVSSEELGLDIYQFENKFYSIEVSNNNHVGLLGLPEFKVGQQVQVLRTSGEFDSGWYVSSIENSKVSVRKPYANTTFKKTIDISNLYKWNLKRE